jgi:hypothetical protein
MDDREGILKCLQSRCSVLGQRLSTVFQQDLAELTPTEAKQLEQTLDELEKQLSRWFS